MLGPVIYNAVLGTRFKIVYGYQGGVYIDLAAFKGVATLPEKYEITLADVRGALARQGLKESDIEPGDALLFNIGWWRIWPDARTNTGNPAYAGREVVDWIIARKPSMIGSDCNLDGQESLVHTDVTMKNGIWNLEHRARQRYLHQR